MNAFEKVLLGILATATTAAPIFVHSPQGLVVLNASEQLLANILVQFQQPKA